MNASTILRFLILVGTILNLLVWLYWAKKEKRYVNYSLSPILFSVHGLIFLTLAGFNLIPRDVFIIWRDIISIHGLIILISTGIVLIETTGGKK